MGQNGIVRADVTEYIYLPQSTFTHTLCFILDKKKTECGGGVSMVGTGGGGCGGSGGVRGAGKGVMDEEDGK